MFQTRHGDRPGIPNYLVVITDGLSDNTRLAWIEALATRARGITILAVGLHDAIRCDALKGPFIVTQLSSTEHDVEFSCVAINGPLEYRVNYSATSNNMKLVHWVELEPRRR